MGCITIIMKKVARKKAKKKGGWGFGGRPSDQGSAGAPAVEFEPWSGAIEVVSAWNPRAYMLRNILTEEECDYLIAKSEKSLRASGVVDNETGLSTMSKVRTSDGTFFNRHHDEMITRIEAKIAGVTMIPERDGEGLQILRYKIGQKYDAHHDYFHDNVNGDAAHGGQRVATLLMYLTTPEEGGETIFPNGEVPADHNPADWSECAKGKLGVKPRRGDAMLFYSLTPSGEKDPFSLHGSCPVVKGIKYSATRWMHVHPFMVGPRRKNPKNYPKTDAAPAFKSLGGDCTDRHEDCGDWAATGECKKNPGYMLESCRASCNACPEAPSP